MNLLENRDNKSAENKFDKANFVLMTKDLTKSKIFVAEAAKSAVIDTACTKTAAFKPQFIITCQILEKTSRIQHQIY